MAKNKAIKETAATQMGEESNFFDEIDFDEEDKVKTMDISASLLRKYEDAFSRATAKAIMKKDWLKMTSQQVHDVIQRLIEKTVNGQGVVVEDVAQDLVSKWFSEEALVKSYIAVRDGKVNGMDVNVRDYPVHLQTLMPKIRDAAKEFCTSNAQRLKCAFLFEQAGRAFMPGRTVTMADFDMNLKAIYPKFTRGVVNALAELASNQADTKDVLAEFADEIQAKVIEALAPLKEQMWAAFKNVNK